MSTDDPKMPTCKGCVHFFITHEPGFPYGCKALQFKSRRHPCIDVENASGIPCQAREAAGHPVAAGKHGKN